MKKITTAITKELVLHVDFETGEFEIGWVWVIFYSGLLAHRIFLLVI